MAKFLVIGAGLAGLFAAAILRDECDSVLEAQSNLPNNHTALLRFRSSVVGDALNIPFRKVSVMKAVATMGKGPIADAISYSLKTNGSAQLRSIIGVNGMMEDRYIAPPDFPTRLREKVNCNIALDFEWNGDNVLNSVPIISTIPMPVLMNLLGYEDRPEFKSVIGYTTTAQLRDTDLCATIYFPDPDVLPYRASITGDQLIVEYAFPNRSEEGAANAMKDLSEYPKKLHDHLWEVLEDFGMSAKQIVGVPKVKVQKYAKILPIPDDERKRFILWASEKYNVFSFGRFATWRPGLLMDDLVHDLRVIQSIVNGGTSYNERKRI